MYSRINIESEVRSYSRAYPAIFDTAHGSWITDADGKQYLDFLSGCGSVNYGHNNDLLVRPLLEYIQRNGITMSMDLASCAKKDFIDAFSELILKKCDLPYRMQFTGPTGANAVEAALKLARKVTGRSNIVAFTNAFHGCSIGALAVTGSGYHRRSSEPYLNHVHRSPYDRYFGEDVDTADMLDCLLSDPSSGVASPAAILFETIQGEGGLNIASPDWCQKLQRVARKHDALVIVDDIQAGCGRSGKFFSFEDMGIDPDIVCLAKGISGLGLPLSLVLLREDLDVWAPGEHNGTFRGNNHAFTTATAALTAYWSDPDFEEIIRARSDQLRTGLEKIACKHGFNVKGRGLMLGLDLTSSELAVDIRRRCFEEGLIVETCGPNDEVLKFLPPLTVEPNECDIALRIVSCSLSHCSNSQARPNSLEASSEVQASTEGSRRKARVSHGRSVT